MDQYDSAGGPSQAPNKKAGKKSGAVGRAFISVHWKCCNSFSRLYKNREGSAYEGRCPRCGSHVKAPVGEGGTSRRLFTAG